MHRLTKWKAINTASSLTIPREFTENMHLYALHWDLWTEDANWKKWLKNFDINRYLFSIPSFASGMCECVSSLRWKTTTYALSLILIIMLKSVLTMLKCDASFLKPTSPTLVKTRLHTPSNSAHRGHGLPLKQSRPWFKLLIWLINKRVLTQEYSANRRICWSEASIHFPER